MLRASNPHPFRYESCLRSNQLRLLRPDRISFGRLSFTVVEFPRLETLRYTAVSYTWGDQQPSEVIYLNGHEFRVRPNLWSCLYYLGQAPQATTAPYLWVDAICINQNDDREKAAQVRLMDQTYRDATTVSVWLGLIRLPDHIRVDGNTDWIKTVDVDSVDLQDAAADLSNRPYWSRVWVIQEFLLARHITLHCSNVTIDWEHFRDIVSEKAGVDPLSENALRMLSQNKLSSGNAYAALPLLLGRHVNKHPEFLQRFCDLLIEHRKAKCSDPRDKVFAMLGLVTREEREFLEIYFPDYKMSEDHVLIITLAHITQLGPLVASLRDPGTITVRSDDLFEALGVWSEGARKRLLHRASQVDYLGRFSAEEMSQLLAMYDDIERCGENVALHGRHSIEAALFPRQDDSLATENRGWSNIIVRGTVILTVLGFVVGSLKLLERFY